MDQYCFDLHRSHFLGALVPATAWRLNPSCTCTCTCIWLRIQRLIQATRAALERELSTWF